MKRFLGFLSAITAMALWIAPAAGAVPVAAQDSGINISAITTTVIVVCSILATAILVIVVLLAKKNMKNR